MKIFISQPHLRPVVLLSWVFLATISWSCHEKDQDQPLPVEVPARVSKIVWGPNDYQAFQYNAPGQITRYVSQWTYINDGSGVTKKITADFQYDNNNRLAKVLFDSGFFTTYTYQGNVLKQSEEYDNRNRRALTHHYQYNSQQRLAEVLTEVHDVVEGDGGQIKRTYLYDNRGNVTEEKMYGKLANENTFHLSTITRYENYDQQKSAENLSAIPYLTQITMNVNNAGKQTVLGSDGSTVASVRTFTYQYNEKGYPTQKTVQVASTPSVPSATATYEYE